MFVCSRFLTLLKKKEMNFVKSNNLSLKYQKFTPSGCKYIGIRKFKVVAKTNPLIILINKIY